MLRPVGEVGRDEGETLCRAVSAALGATGGGVLVDLRSTRHIHFRVAGALARIGRGQRRLGLVGPTPYVRQILRVAGALEGELPVYRTFREAAGDRTA
ncbi:MAG: hypothetical protein SCH98_04625 [Deferrisomatales bacterium]|nr:hypothetical protein [Deferrisomatales bacterium]